MDREKSSVSRAERRVHHIYVWLHIANDALIALEFLIGSLFFLWPALEHAGVWLFVAGSCQMLVGPIIRTANQLQVRRLLREVIDW